MTGVDSRRRDPGRFYRLRDASTNTVKRSSKVNVSGSHVHYSLLDHTDYTQDTYLAA
jgi:hypothetical protein